MDEQHSLSFMKVLRKVQYDILKFLLMLFFVMLCFLWGWLFSVVVLVVWGFWFGFMCVYGFVLV